MLRLQQYERLMKTLLAHHELAVPVDKVDAQRAANIEKVSDKTLGMLVKSLFESFAVPYGFERELLPEDEVPMDRAFMVMSHRITMDPKRLAEVQAEVVALVGMRNDLVHHFIERFNLWSDPGCEAAIRHLEDCYKRIDRHYSELSGWANSWNTAQAFMAAFAQTGAFSDMMVNGIAPDGSFDWPHTGIVRVLREASEALSDDGWTRLGRAREWMAENHPDQTPSKYGCRTWPQVLSESKLFELVYRVGDDGKRAGWFRERSPN